MSSSSLRDNLIEMAIDYVTLVTPEDQARALEKSVFSRHKNSLVATLHTQKKYIQPLAKERGFNPKILLTPMDPFHGIDPLYSLKVARFYFLYENAVLKKENCSDPLNQTDLYQNPDRRHSSATELTSRISTNSNLCSLFVSAMVRDRLDGAQRNDIYFPAPSTTILPANKESKNNPVNNLNRFTFSKSADISSEYHTALATRFLENTIVLLEPQALYDSYILLESGILQQEIQKQKHYREIYQSFKTRFNAEKAQAIAPRKDHFSNN